MVSKSDLSKLVHIRLKDAESLFQKRRYYAAIYFGGYAVECALKYKICKMYRFANGFPETKSELQIYLQQDDVREIPQLKQIRNHDLTLLLQFSGDELKVKNNYFNEWALIFNWNPEMRYKVMIVKKKTSEQHLAAIKKTVNAIL